MFSAVELTCSGVLDNWQFLTNSLHSNTTMIIHMQTFKRISYALFLGVLASCGSQQKPPVAANAAIPVTVARAESKAASYYDEYPGTVVALQQTEIRPQVTGYITGIHFQDGAKVQKGQRLYSIDQQLYNANYDQAVANLQVQETNLVKAQKDADRYHELLRQDAVAKQQVDYADAALEAAKKQVAAAQANVSALRTNLGFANIVAPFTGTIGISQVRLGTSVVAGQSILNTISSNDPVAVDFSLDQSKLYEFTEMLNQPSKTGDSSFTLAFGTELYPRAGKIQLVDRAVDPQTGTIRVRLQFANPENRLRPGMTATVRVLASSGHPVVQIPYKAVTEQLGEYFVYVVGDSNKVTQKKVELGRQMQGDVLIREGLQEGETIVIQGVQNLREGAVVSPAAAKP